MEEFFERINEKALSLIAVGISIIALFLILIIPLGKEGIIGSIGPEGPRGEQGEQGFRGPQGEVGSIGKEGLEGSSGSQGPQGEKGPVGDTLGIVGDVGPQGNTGNIGKTGLRGIRGEKGKKGEDGKIGKIGPRGQIGEPGFIYPAPVTLSSPTFNYPLVLNPAGVSVIFSTAGCLELGEGSIRPRINLPDRSALRVQFTHDLEDVNIQVGVQFFTSFSGWSSFVPMFGEETQSFTQQVSPFYAITPSMGTDFTTRIMVCSPGEYSPKFTYIAVDAR